MASDVGIDDKYLPASEYTVQDNLNHISKWTTDNLMKLNAAKGNYMVFSRANQHIDTRLQIDNTILERKSVAKILGVWISDDLSWTKNCQEICRKAYSQISMLTKLKYVGFR